MIHNQVEASFRKKLLRVSVVGVFLYAQCISAQLVAGSSSIRSDPTGSPASLRFSVVSIRSDAPDDRGWTLDFTPDGCSARGITLFRLIQETYGIVEGDRIVGLPRWAYFQKFNLEAKVDSDDVTVYQGLDLNHHRLMLQAVLADRFQLTVHRETVLQPGYALVIANKGPRIQESRPEDEPSTHIKGLGGTVSLGRGQLDVKWVTMTNFAKILSAQLRQHVADDTGLTKRYNFKLQWNPDELGTPAVNGANEGAPPTDSSEPSIFAAIKDQLGLRLKPAKVPVERIVVDRLEQPSAN